MKEHLLTFLLKAGASSHSTGKVLEWYYIVGPLSAVIIVTFVSWYFCKRRIAGMILCPFCFTLWFMTCLASKSRRESG